MFIIKIVNMNRFTLIVRAINSSTMCVSVFMNLSHVRVLSKIFLVYNFIVSSRLFLLSFVFFLLFSFFLSSSFFSFSLSIFPLNVNAKRFFLFFFFLFFFLVSSLLTIFPSPKALLPFFPCSSGGVILSNQRKEC